MPLLQVLKEEILIQIFNSYIRVNILCQVERGLFTILLDM
jgi:hypothetical protein